MPVRVAGQEPAPTPDVADDPSTDVQAAPVGGSLLERARAAYRQRTSAAANNVPVIADPDTDETIMWLRLGVPEEAQVTMVRQMLLDQAAGRTATSVEDHARFVAACVRGLGEQDPHSPGKVVPVRTAAGAEVSWVPFVADMTGRTCSSPEEAVVALFTAPDTPGGVPRVDAQALAEVADMHRTLVMARTQQARKTATDPGA